MSAEDIHVQWPDLPAELSLPRPPGHAGTLADRFAHAGRPLNTRCGQRGRCAGCTVTLRDGRFQEHTGAVILAPAEIKACRGDVAPGGRARLAVPSRSIAVHRPQVVTHFKVNVSAAHAPLLPWVPDGTDHAFAIDLGTTTVVVALVELNHGRIVAVASDLNRQVELGDDVLTRIQLAGAPAARAALREAVARRTLDPLMRAACTAAGVASSRVAGAVVAGNTTMLHLLTGTDPTSLGVAPFRATFTDHRVFTAAALGWTVVPPAAAVHLLPGFSAYVGADLVAGCVCTGLHHATRPTLLVDLGTNGEILLRHGGRMLATATAAGPAFEGGRMTQGTRAVAGAIAHVTLPPGPFSPRLEVIPGASGILGLCGSAYVDFLAQASHSGLLQPNGRFDPARWNEIPPACRQENGDGRGIRLLAGDSATTITEGDIAELLQAKAAVAAGIVTILRHAGLTPAAVHRLYLAGGFGLHLDGAAAIACGLLPGFTRAQIEVVGNTSLGGAWLALIDRTILPEMVATSLGAEIIELNLEPGFEDTFIDQLCLPA